MDALSAVERILVTIRAIPRGETAAYGVVAQRAGLLTGLAGSEANVNLGQPSSCPSDRVAHPLACLAAHQQLWGSRGELQFRTFVWVAVRYGRALCYWPCSSRIETTCTLHISFLPFSFSQRPEYIGRYNSAWAGGLAI